MKFLTNPGEIAGAMYDLNNEFLGHARREEIELMVGTCAYESNMGKFRIQIGGGPAKGIMQIEPATAADMWGRFLQVHRPQLYARFMFMCFGISDRDKFFYLPVDEDVLMSFVTVFDDLSILLARTKYLTDPRPIPKKLHDQAAYYKRVYNTAAGGGSTGGYLKAWRDHGCADLVDMVFPSLRERIEGRHR